MIKVKATLKESKREPDGKYVFQLRKRTIVTDTPQIEFEIAEADYLVNLNYILDIEDYTSIHLDVK